MYSVIESTSALQEAIQIASKMMPQLPSAYLSESIIKAVQSPLKEAVEQTYEPIRASHLKMMEATSRLSEYFRIAANDVDNQALQNLIKSVAINDSVRSTFKSINYDLNRSYMKAISNLSINTNLIEAAIRHNLELFRGVDLSSLIQAINIDNPDYDNFDLESALNEAVIDLNNNISFQQKIVSLLEKFKKANPVIFLLLYFFILSPLQAAYNDAVMKLLTTNTKPIVAEVSTSETKTIEKNIKIEVNNTLNINFDSNEIKQQILNQYRYVSTDALIIRKDKSVNSKALYTLEFGQVVRLLYKNKNWTLIEYVDEDDNIIQGWVFTRYISRFKK
ncbi:MAG: SH3 domain-containing protein [Tepidibacillus sp.]